MTHPVTKIISGGQTGADQAGLLAGLTLKIPTGGTAPPGFKTDIGPDPVRLMAYGLVEGEPDPRTYPKRTHKNVADSDGTVLFGNMDSPGCSLTIRCCFVLGKPWITNPTEDKLLEWAREKNIHILNVAGNRERTNSKVFNQAFQTIVGALGTH